MFLKTFFSFFFKETADFAKQSLWSLFVTKKRYFTSFLYDFCFTAFRRVYNGFVITCKKHFSLTTSYFFFCNFWICTKFIVLIRIVLLWKTFWMFYLFWRKFLLYILHLLQAVCAVLFVYLNWFQVSMMHWLFSFSLENRYDFYFPNDRGMSSSHKSFHQRPYFMVVFRNETSAIDKENFRIVFLKKPNELFKRFFFKMMM